MPWELVCKGSTNELQDRRRRPPRFGLADDTGFLGTGFVPLERRAEAYDKLTEALDRYRRALESNQLVEANAALARRLIAETEARLLDIQTQGDTPLDFQIRNQRRAIQAQREQIRSLERFGQVASILRNTFGRFGLPLAPGTGGLVEQLVGDPQENREALRVANEGLERMVAALERLQSGDTTSIVENVVPTEAPLGFTEFTQNYERMLRNTRAQIRLLELDLEEATEIGTDPLRPDAILDPRTVEAIKAEIARLKEVLDGAAEGGFNLARALAQIDRQIARASDDPLAPFLEIQARLDSFRAAGASESDLSTLGGRLGDLAAARAIASNNEQLREFGRLQSEVTTQVENTNAALLIERDYLLGNIDAEGKSSPAVRAGIRKPHTDNRGHARAGATGRKVETGKTKPYWSSFVDKSS